MGIYGLNLHRTWRHRITESWYC